MSYEIISMNEYDVVVRMPTGTWQDIVESHPAKTLTDEELVILMNTAKILLQKFGDLTDENMAILRKAQEK
jgi:hypothetical protein